MSEFIWFHDELLNEENIVKVRRNKVGRGPKVIIETVDGRTTSMEYKTADLRDQYFEELTGKLDGSSFVDNFFSGEDVADSDPNLCPECERGILRDTGIMLTSMPPQLKFECDVCGHTQNRVNASELKGWTPPRGFNNESDFS